MAKDQPFSLEGALAGLSGHMERILAIIAEGRRSLAVPEASEWQALALSRWQMLRAIDGFIGYKRDLILRPLARATSAVVAARARALEASNHDLRASYDAFVTHWALNSPVSADAPYRAAALEMAGRIERQVIHEVQELEQLVHAADRDG